MGKLIVIEGIDGSGKSTQFRLLKDFLDRKSDVASKVLEFPRYSSSSSALIKMYLSGQFGDDPSSVNPYAASTFFTVDRYASFMQDWKDFYDNGGVILTDRYTGSNAIHQGAKLSRDDRDEFFRWLGEFEFTYIGIPKPDIVFYMSICAEIAVRRLTERQRKTGEEADIHERDFGHLKDSAECGMQASAYYGWKNISCVTNGKERAELEIHQELCEEVTCLLR